MNTAWRRREPASVEKMIQWECVRLYQTIPLVRHGTNGSRCNSTFSICIYGTSIPLETLGNDKTIYSGSVGGLPVKNTLKIYWKHLKMIEIKQVTKRTREIYLSRPPCSHTLVPYAYLVEWIISNTPTWRDTICETNRLHAQRLIGTRSPNFKVF